MKIYLVGGAVRDKLLGLPVKEKDWVVVGSTEEEMLRLGFRAVGKDFPVFLHPETHEEYALARTERKIKRGYTGFEFNASARVTLEEDLLRRDLTINAMAETMNGQLIDPYHGADDLKQKLLRHVSAAFVEDPVRVLRVARFLARFAHLGFVIAAETQALMKQMVTSGEVDALVPERVWKELTITFSEQSPEQFFEVLAECGALPKLFPEIKMEGSGMKALKKAANDESRDPVVCFAALMHDVTENQIDNLSDRYRVPSDYRELAKLVARYITCYQEGLYKSASHVLDLLQGVDAFRREERFKQFLTACATVSSHQRETWWQYFEEAKKIDIKKIIAAGFSGKNIAEALKKERIACIQKLKDS